MTEGDMSEALGGFPPRQRATDMPVGNIELILYQLSEIKNLLVKLDSRLERVESRMTALERFRERVEERDRADAASATTVNARWVPILIAGLSAAVLIILFVIGQGHA